jgi:4-hydroxythreonine-4-phosphate dehydrogenase
MNLSVTVGDPDGIGPEILAKIIKSKKLMSKIYSRLILFGPENVFEPYHLSVYKTHSISEAVRVKKQKVVLLSPQVGSKFKNRDHYCGFYSGWAIESAARSVLNNYTKALITGPISKKRLNLAGYCFPGHTQMLAKICSTPKKEVFPVMMLANSMFRVAVTTNHIPLNRVSDTISRHLLLKTFSTVSKDLQRRFGIRKPKIAVCGINPHAGESGLLGSEESRIIIPAINEFNRSQRRSTLYGPFPADTFFAIESVQKKYDAVICQYHDQGLIPVKLADFKNTINITLGLPIIRTSVDHGTGFDIVGKGVADVSSFYQAIIQAQAMAENSRGAKI